VKDIAREIEKEIESQIFVGFSFAWKLCYTRN